MDYHRSDLCNMLLLNFSRPQYYCWQQKEYGVKKNIVVREH